MPYAGAIPAERVPEGVPACGAGLAGDHLHPAPERHPGRRDGPGQNHHDHRPAGPSGLREVGRPSLPAISILLREILACKVIGNACASALF